MDKDKKMLLEYAEDIQIVEEKYPDLRIPLAENIKINGLGK
ncbi:hypothetical protein [Parachlamydia sp. AcF125]|nr:hypothetical protein [Parachlamydia sp. AcF125]MBS4168726.1 hypothetical protein [Parachlamydia sp. AcF125]